MSKPVKEMIRKELAGRLEGIMSVAVVGLTGIDAVKNNQIRKRLLEKDIHLSVVKNSLAKQAFKEIGLDRACELLIGPCALAFGSDNIVTVVRELRDIAKDVKELSVKGALLDGDLFGAERMAELADFPTRDEAISQVLSAVLSAGANLVACIIAPGAQIASVLKAIEEKGGISSDGEDSGVAEAVADPAGDESAETDQRPAE